MCDSGNEDSMQMTSGKAEDELSRLAAVTCFLTGVKSLLLRLIEDHSLVPGIHPPDYRVVFEFIYLQDLRDSSFS